MMGVSRRGAALALTSMLLVSGCAFRGTTGQPIIGARLLPEDSAAVEVEFSGCDDSPEVDVFESDSTVRITVAGPNGGCEPVHELTVRLDEPLGDRTLVDGATGRELSALGE